MTNKQKAMEVLEKTFGIKIIDDRDFNTCFARCGFIDPQDECAKGYTHCDSCMYHTFWEDEYIEPTQEDNEEAELIKQLYFGLTESMQRAIRNVMRVGNGLEIEEDYKNEKLRKG